MKIKKVMVSGCYDLLHSGHVAFFENAAMYGNLYVCLGSDDNIEKLKNMRPRYDQNERLFMVQSIKYVHHAQVSKGTGYLDFKDELIAINPDIFIVNEDGDREEKKELCDQYNIDYLVLKRLPKEGLVPRSSTVLKEDEILPSRLCLAGGWMDQPFVNSVSKGSVVTVQIEHECHFMQRAGLASSTRKSWEKLNKFKPKVDNCEEFAKLLFGYENYPGKKYLSGSQDAIGLTHNGINRLDYDNNHWPYNIESCRDKDVYDWLENHLWLIPLEQRYEGYNPYLNKNITEEGVSRLSLTGERCYEAILNKDLSELGQSLTATHDAWREILPSTTNKKIDDLLKSYNGVCEGGTTTGCGGGYIILATEKKLKEGFRIKLRRS